tara:strand:+ start:108 stop:932 length:825 start_codon:yes stop_codon:yes gene_type:complete
MIKLMTILNSKFKQMVSFCNSYKKTFLFLGFLSLSFILLAHYTDALAQSLTLDMGDSGGGDDPGTMSGRIIQLILILTVLSLAPSILVMMTSFTRIVVVFSFLRTAMGLQQTPPNTVIISLAMFMTLFIMQPTLEKAYEDAYLPLINESINEVEAFERGVQPFKDFMLKNTRQQDLSLFYGLAEETPPENAQETPLRILVPSFMISELKRAFEIGFMIFMPFLIIDLVTASILMSMGMMMLPPVMISLPFKIIFFVLVDGWYLLTGSLIQSFVQ